MKGEQSLAHTKWECKYHVVFAPKFRRKAIYGRLRRDISQILIELCKRKGIEIIEAEACIDHIHMLLTIPPKHSISQVMGYLKGKSSLIIFDRHANLKYKYGNRHFWCRGYYVSTVGRNEKKIKAYIANQLQEDYYQDQISLKEYIDPFTGAREPQSSKKTALAVAETEGARGSHSKGRKALAGNSPLQGRSKPPAKPVVLIFEK